MATISPYHSSTSRRARRESVRRRDQVAALFRKWAFGAAAPAALALAAAPGHAMQTISQAIADNDGFTMDVNTTDVRILGSGSYALGDIDGDGFEDFAVGSAIDYDIFGSRIHVVFGSKTFPAGGNLIMDNLDGTNGFTFVTSGTGQSIGIGGNFDVLDLDGDGETDFVFGRNGDYQGGGINNGAVHVLFGPGPGTAIVDTDTTGPDLIRIYGQGDFDGIGNSVANAGDLNDDGIDDLAVTGFYSSMLVGEHGFVLFGDSTRPPIESSSAGPLAGTGGFGFYCSDGSQSINTVRGIGDFNGDGIDDLLIMGNEGYNSGFPYFNNYVRAVNWIIFGSATPAPLYDLSSLAASDGMTIEDNFQSGYVRFNGFASAAGFDFNGDGFTDIAIGNPTKRAYGADRAGAVSIIFGNTVPGGTHQLNTLAGTGHAAIISGFSADGYQGTGVASLGDLDGDGYDDLVIAAAAQNSIAGVLRVVLGEPSPPPFQADILVPSPLLISGDEPLGLLGYGVATADTNNRGFREIITGAPFLPGAQRVGRAYLLSLDPLANLLLNKSVAPATLLVGGALTYTFDITNQSAETTATGVILTDTLPPEVALLSVDEPPGSSVVTAGNDITVQLPDIPPGGSLQVTASAIAISHGTAVNTAVVGLDGNDANAADNSSTAFAAIAPRADLAITKTATPQVDINDPITYVVTVTNNGPSVANQVLVVDALPAGINFVSAHATLGTAFPFFNTVQLAIPSLPVSGTATLTITVDTPTPGTYVNIASGSSNAADTIPENNAAFASTTVIDPSAITGSADVAVTKSAPPNALIGQPFDYVVTVANSGPDAANDVVVTDLLPNPAVFEVTATNSTLGSAAVTSQGVTVTIPTLANGQSAAITISGFAKAEGTLTNVAAVSGNFADPNLANNVATVQTGVATGPGADLSGRFDPTKPPAVKVTNKGERIQSRVVVFNTGDAEAGKSTARFYLSADGEFDPATNTLIATRNLGKVKPLKQRNLVAKGLLTTGTASGQYILAVLDADDIVPEGNEFNNVVKFGPLP